MFQKNLINLGSASFSAPAPGARQSKSNFTGGNPRTGYVAPIEVMKSFAYITRLSAVVLAAFLLNSQPICGQIPGADKNTAGMNASMVKLFGSNTNFVSKAEARVVDKNQRETTKMSMGFDMLAGKIRLDIDIANVKSREMPPELITNMKQMGMDQTITILLPDQKSIISIYPGLKSYAESPMPKEDVEAAAKQYKLEKTHVAKETIDGHPCDKENVTLTDSAGAKEHVTVWYAADLKDFPIQMQIPNEDSTLTMKFTDVKLGRPELSQFQAPAGMTKYDNVNALMSDAVTKKMNLGTPK
jgi:Domain of unknown function (DUF4412)